MSLGQPALVAITPQNPHQGPTTFVKNVTTRSSFCGTPTSTGRSFLSNRKSWNGTGTLPLQVTPIEDPTPSLATFRSRIGGVLSPQIEDRAVPNHRRDSYEGADELLSPGGRTGNETRRSPGNGHGRRYAEIGNWAAR